MSSGTPTTLPGPGLDSMPAGCTVATCPLAKASPTPLSKPVLDKIAKCPAMKDDLEKLQKDGWTVVWGKPGGGSFADRPTKTITADPTSANDDDVVATMAHEMGHAQYTLPSVPIANSTKADYVKNKVQSNLEDEGEATLKQIQYKQCLKKNGGPDIPISGAKAAEYEKIAQKYPDPKDQEKARTEIANVFGDNEHPSNCPGQTYRQYYASPCCAPGCGTGAQGYVDSISADDWEKYGGKK